VVTGALPQNKYVGIAGTVINIVLRTLTNTGVTLDNSNNEIPLDGGFK